MIKGYSTYLKPIAILIDLIVLNVTMFVLTNEVMVPASIVFFNTTWLLIAINTKLYVIFRYTKMPKVVSRLLLQFAYYYLSYFAYFGIFKEGDNIQNQRVTLTIIFGVIFVLKLLYVFTLRKYRVGGGNFRNVVILGGSQSVETLKNLFEERNYLGYNYIGYFSDKHFEKENYLGKLEDSFDYILENNIDEVYCSVTAFSREKLKKVIEFGEEHYITVKLIPTTTGMFSKGIEVEYYDYVPVLSLKKLPFDNPLIKYSKRFFDIVFSLVVIVFVLSWLSILLFIIIKIETKGPFVFKQVRDGLNGSQFHCYKFRSMGVNKDSDLKQATREDIRVTRVGKFIRKTSIDEVPQFINVFLGDMSVVGPRPHMISHSKKYSKRIDRYFMRNLVKPGVTGLAQVRGFRGEIEKESDMENRVRLDLFYINNWSFVLDIKIIFQTVFNAMRGEEKAY